MIQKIKEIYKLLNAYKKIKEAMKKMNEPKAGIKSTEFAVLVGNLVVAITGVVAGQIPVEIVAIAIPVLSGIYIAGRSLVKLTKTKTDDMVIEKIGQVIEKLKK